MVGNRAESHRDAGDAHMVGSDPGRLLNERRVPGMRSPEARGAHHPDATLIVAHAEKRDLAVAAGEVLQPAQVGRRHVLHKPDVAG